MIAAPHNFKLGFCFGPGQHSYILRVPVRYTVKKKELLKGPLKWILNGLGAIGIDRTHKEGQKEIDD